MLARCAIARLSALLTCLAALLTFNAAAEPPTAEGLSGTWRFTHMILDGDVDNPRPANVVMEFSADGTIVSHYGEGDGAAATFRIEGDTIVYADKNGAQRWKVIVFSESTMQVNHSGAEMFFERE